MASKYKTSLSFISNVCNTFRNASSENPIKALSDGLNGFDFDIHPSITRMWEKTVSAETVSTHALAAAQTALNRIERINQRRRSLATDRRQHQRYVRLISRRLLQLNREGSQMMAAGQDASTNVDWLFEQSLWQYRRSEAGLTLFNILQKDAGLRTTLERRMAKFEQMKAGLPALKEQELAWIQRWFELERLVEELAAPSVEADSLGVGAGNEVEVSYEALQGIVDGVIERQ